MHFCLRASITRLDQYRNLTKPFVVTREMPRVSEIVDDTMLVEPIDPDYSPQPVYKFPPDIFPP